MTELQLRQLVVKTFEEWVGYNETNGKHKLIIDLYNTQNPLPVNYKVKYSDEWCATTVSAVGVKLGLSKYILPECSCSRMIALYKNAGRWEENDAYVPTLGDIIMWDWDDAKDQSKDNTGAPEHVGMVTKCSNGTITVIEGNKKEAVGYREVQVNGRYIRGYCLPDYKTAAKTYIDAQSTTSKITYITGRLPLLSRGDTGRPVRVLQGALNAIGYDCGDVDGSFGPKTETAVIELQKASGFIKSKQNGKVNAAVWGAIL